MLPLAALPSLRPMFATPVYDGAKPPYVASLWGLAAQMGRLGVDAVLQLLGESLITRARNRLVMRFLEDETRTHLFWIDSDIGFSVEAVLRLLLADRDVVAGVYPLKRYNEDGSLSYPFNPIDGRLKADGEGFAAVAEAPTGFMCVKREVIYKMMAAYPELQYTPEARPEDEAMSDKRASLHWRLFDTMVDPKTRRFLSEDYAFCQRWRVMGGDVFIDLHSKLQHEGRHVYQGDLLAYLRAR